MDTGRNILSDDKAKTLREIIEQEEETGQIFTMKITVAPVRGSSKTAEALWAALGVMERALQIEHKEPTATEMHERARREFELHEAWTVHGGRSDDHDDGADRHGGQG